MVRAYIGRQLDFLDSICFDDLFCVLKEEKKSFFLSLQSSLLFIMEELAGGISLAVANDIIVTGDIFVFFLSIESFLEYVKKHNILFNQKEYDFKNFTLQLC